MRLNCQCGHHTHLSGHSKNELFIIDIPTLEKIENHMDNNPGLTTDDFHTVFLTYAQQADRCEKCGRLYIDDEENGKDIIRVYNQEEVLRDEEDEES